MNRVELKIPGDHSGESEWHEIIPGERFRIRTSVRETDGLYMTLEIIADPRNGVPMHVHANEEECFIVLEGSLHLVNGDQRLNLSPVMWRPSRGGRRTHGAISRRRACGF